MDLGQLGTVFDTRDYDILVQHTNIRRPEYLDNIIGDLPYVFKLQSGRSSYYPEPNRRILVQRGLKHKNGFLQGLSSCLHFRGCD